MPFTIIPCFLTVSAIYTYRTFQKKTSGFFLIFFSVYEFRLIVFKSLSNIAVRTAALESNCHTIQVEVSYCSVAKFAEPGSMTRLMVSKFESNITVFLVMEKFAV